jgi:hypothetical protein
MSVSRTTNRNYRHDQDDGGASECQKRTRTLDEEPEDRVLDAIAEAKQHERRDQRQQELQYRECLGDIHFTHFAL